MTPEVLEQQETPVPVDEASLEDIFVDEAVAP